MGMRLLLKTREMMTITIVISTQMMGRVILLPSPMIITTLRGIYQTMWGCMDDIDKMVSKDDGGGGSCDVILPSTIHPMRSLEQILTDR